MSSARRLVAALGLLSVAAVFAADQTKPVAPAEPPVQLAPYAVNSTPVNSYAFDLVVRVSKETGKIVSLVISGVRENSDADQADLRPGDEITKINGVPVTEMDPQLGPDGQLGKLLLNRPKGERLDLEVVIHRKARATLHAVGPTPGW
jgi:predicted metalloprotease with PDZ domain